MSTVSVWRLNAVTCGGSAMPKDSLQIASWALRWFEHHRSLTRARQAALSAARKHHAVENSASAMTHGSTRRKITDLGCIMT